MAIPRAERFRIQPVARGIWAAIGNRTRGVPSNAGIIDLESAVLIVDALPTLQAADELWTAARMLTGRDPGALVTTHAHVDHWLGNSRFAECEIFGTAFTRDRILESGPAFLQAHGGDAGTRALEAVEARWEEERRPLFREELAVDRAAREDLYEMYRSLWVQAPNQLYATRHRLPSRRSAWFVEVAGHTESDTMVFVPDAEVLFAGDIVSIGVHPSLASGRVDRWKDALAGIEKIHPARVVPGHGPVSELSECGAVREYLSALEEASRGPDPEEVPVPYRDWLSPSIYYQNLADVRRSRIIDG